ncbi:hypothetical protein BaRGS_00006227, partial [Batillaria attramentaria]
EGRTVAMDTGVFYVSGDLSRDETHDLLSDDEVFDDEDDASGLHGRPSGASRLKRRFQFLVVGTILFMLTVSFLILKPEIFASSSASSGPVGAFGAQPNGGEEVIVNRIQLPAENGKLQGGELDGKPVMVYKVIEELAREYSVDFGYQLRKDQSPWQIAAKWVSAREVLPEKAPELGAILNAMATSEIIAVDNGIGGTQLKLSMKLAGGQLVAFKPKWYERDYIVEGAPYAGRDRHNGEIAAFHLSRILGFRRTPLAVGRVLNLRKDIAPIATQDLWKTFHDIDGNLCFYGKCHYCNKDNMLCADGDRLEGTVILWLPTNIKLRTERHPWRRLYRDRLLAKWEKDESYCSIVRQVDPYRNNSYILLDIIDTAVFDYLIGNADRHHYEVIKGADKGMLCCSIRYSTWQRLLSLQNSVLSSVLNLVMVSDPIHPVLTQLHLDALDRRLDKVLQEVQQCIDLNGMETVIMDDR